MKKGKETTELKIKKIEILDHKEIVSRILFLNKEKGIRFKQIAKEAEIKGYYYFLQQINEGFPNQLFRERSQIRMNNYFQKPEIKMMLKGFIK